jgi:hypothetical protein
MYIFGRHISGIPRTTFAAALVTFGAGANKKHTKKHII